MKNDCLFLVGLNGAGKSSVIQSLAFIQRFAAGRPDQFFEERGWSPIDLVTKDRAIRSRAISYEILLESPMGDQVYWQVIWGAASESLIGEAIWAKKQAEKNPVNLLSFSGHAGLAEPDREKPLKIRAHGSIMSLFDADDLLTTEMAPYRTLLQQALEWAEGITSLELLSPNAMRRTARGNQKDIGARGEYLAGYLASQGGNIRERIVRRLSKYYPIESLTTVKKKAGWVDLRIAEAFEIARSIKAAHVSDGFLRLLAMCTVPEFGRNASLVLLDEIEDGIEPHILPRLIADIMEEARTQFIMTSHSPLLVNHFNPQDVYFVVRNRVGLTRAAKASEIESIDFRSEHFGVGEMWVNHQSSDIASAVLREHPRVHMNERFISRELASAEHVKRFMSRA
jgi:predicted ATPase